MEKNYEIISVSAFRTYIGDSGRVLEKPEWRCRARCRHKENGEIFVVMMFSTFTDEVTEEEMKELLLKQMPDKYEIEDINNGWLELMEGENGDNRSEQS